VGSRLTEQQKTERHASLSKDGSWVCQKYLQLCGSCKLQL